MKKLLIIVALLFTYQITNAQISARKAAKWDKVGKSEMMGNVVMEKSGNLYAVTYLDAQYEQIREFKTFYFEDKENAFEEFYKIISNGLKEQPEEPIIVDFPDEKLYLYFKKTFGIPVVEWKHVNEGNSGYSISLDQRKIDKLFGKR